MVEIYLIIACNCEERETEVPYGFYDEYCSRCDMFPVIVGVKIDGKIIKPFGIKDGGVYDKDGNEIEV